jgi:hypothetical protein
MSDANKHSAIKGYGDALKQEAELENARYKNDSSLRSSNDDMSDLFSSISEAAKSPGGRPRGIGASIAAGFSEGISTGYKMKSTNEKKEKYNKYNNVMSYLQKTQAEVTKQNKHYAEQEQRMETVKPFAIGALEVAYSGMDYNEGNERMRNIIEQAKLADPSIKGDYIGYVPNSPIVNLRDQNGNITAFSLSSLTGEEPAKRIQHNYIEGQKLDIEKTNAPVKYGAMQDKLKETKRRNDFMGLKNDLKLVETFGKKIDASREFLTIVPHMKDILTKHPDIFQSAGQVIWQNDKEPGYMDNFLRTVNQKMAPDKADAITKMIKYINKMTLDVSNGFSRPNMYLEKTGGKAVPNLNMTVQGFSDILAEMELENRETLTNNLSRMERLESDVGSGITDQYKESTNKVSGKVTEKATDMSPLAKYGKRVQ